MYSAFQCWSMSQYTKFPTCFLILKNKKEKKTAHSINKYKQTNPNLFQQILHLVEPQGRWLLYRQNYSGKIKRSAPQDCAFFETWKSWNVFVESSHSSEPKSQGQDIHVWQQREGMVLASGVQNWRFLHGANHRVAK